MPVLIDIDQHDHHLFARAPGGSAAAEVPPGERIECLDIGLINNMPDSALEDTEMQFFELIDAASGDMPVFVSLYSLPEVPRGELSQQHIKKFYFDFQTLLHSRLDGIIITGTEPRHKNLRDEPYWHSLTAAFDWAETNTTSTILSCLAAHASVLHSDGVQRVPLPDKQFGVFGYTKIANYAFIAEAADSSRFPHSRWNEVREASLVARGYTVLDRSAEAGVNLFAKQKKQSLFVYLQGHPEYFTHTLLKEYRRDIRRFLAAERETYPSMPHGYFDEAATRLLDDFRQAAELDRREDLLASFPERLLIGYIKNSWQSSSTALYRDWLGHLSSARSSEHPKSLLLA